MLKRHKKKVLLLADVIAIILSVFLAVIIKYEFDIPVDFVIGMKNMAVSIVLLKLFVYNCFTLYDSLWEFASIEELLQIVTGTIVANAICVLFSLVQGYTYPITLIALIVILDIMLTGIIRLSYRILRRFKNHRSLLKQKYDKNILIIGAGSTAGMISKEIKNHPDVYGRIKGFIDDDPLKYKKVINGIKVIGNRHDIYSVCKRYNIDEIIFAIPTVDPQDKAHILEECKKTECKVRTVPGIREIVDGNVSMNELRDVNIEDLLGRDSVKLNSDEISGYLNGKVVLVTGGGGSIGSELCRQISMFAPKKLIILDIYENNAYDIQNELKRNFSDLNLETIIASVRDRDNIMGLFEQLKPNVVFHAAAHKHVPLMEHAPKEAIKNNVFGTLNVAQAADIHNVERFVLISTDKAVNPTNVMGASKRICEMIIQSINKKSHTKFVGVRFGNVLGSNGSVIPLFKRQIAEGGPVTVTHKDIIRYFMTIPEATQLVLQAGALAEGGEIFVLDMGDPVRIVDLAEDLIHLSGFKPYEDIDIHFTGLRPGEKLFEELLLTDEIIKSTTQNEKIFIGKPALLDYKILLHNLDNLKKIVELRDNDELREYIGKIVPTYQRDGKVINDRFSEKGGIKGFDTAYGSN